MQFANSPISGMISGFIVTQRDLFLLWVPVFLGCGAGIYFGFQNEPPFPAVLTGFVALSILALCAGRALRRADDPNRRYLFWLLAMAAFWTVAGLLVAQIQARVVQTPMLAAESKIAEVQGRIESLERLENRRGSLVVLDQVTIDDWDAGQTPRKVRLTIRNKTTELTLGDRISVLAKLHAASAPVMPGAFDFQRFYYFKSIGANGFSLREPAILDRAGENSPDFLLDHIRKAIAAQVALVLDERVGGIATALMTGERAAISDKDWQALRASGLAHIISISGLHVALVAAPVFFIVRLLLAAIPFIALRWPIKKIAAAVALLVCCLYVAIVVPNVPTFRALMMTGIGLIAIMLDRSPFSMRLVALAAAVVLLLSPDSIWSASFQMSFAAVVALIAVAETLRPYWSSYLRGGGWGRRMIVYIAGAITTTTVASLATSPFSSFHFQQIATYSVVANTLATPLTGLVVMPMMVLSFFLLPFGLAAQPLQAMGKGIEWMLDVGQMVAAWPGAVLTTPSWPLTALVLMVFGGLVLLLLAGRVRLFSIPLFLVSLVVITLAEQPRLIVSGDGSVIMVNQKETSFLSSQKKEKFATEVWGRRIDAESVKSWPREGVMQEGDIAISCDTDACRIEIGSQKIAAVKNLYALKAECGWASLIVIPEKKVGLHESGCMVPIYDRWHLRETGALAIMPDGTIIDVRQDQGTRPWSTWPPLRRFK